MFWKKKSSSENQEKLLGPKEIPQIVKKYLVEERKLSPDLVNLLKSVVRKSSDSEALNIRVFDESDALARKVQVKDYTTLNEHPELTLYEGQYNESTMLVQLDEKKKVDWDTTIFTEAQIQQKIESLTEAGSSVFFYLARGPAHGGPLGMGAAIVKINLSQQGKKPKKYGTYTADVVDTRPIDEMQKLFDSNKSKDVARWIKEAHHKRMY